MFILKETHDLSLPTNDVIELRINGGVTVLNMLREQWQDGVANPLDGGGSLTFRTGWSYPLDDLILLSNLRRDNHLLAGDAPELAVASAPEEGVALLTARLCVGRRDGSEDVFGAGIDLGHQPVWQALERSLVRDELSLIVVDDEGVPVKQHRYGYTKAARRAIEAILAAHGNVVPCTPAQHKELFRVWQRQSSQMPSSRAACPPRTSTPTRRNAKCPCGSPAKFKRCCGR